MINSELRSQIVNDYVNNKLSLPQTKLKYGVSYKCITDSVRKAGFQLRSISEGMNKIPVDENYFKKIDSHAKAQILGFIGADGCLSQTTKFSKTISIGLNSIDLPYLEWIKFQLKFDGEIKTTPSRNSYSDKGFISRLTFCNQILCEDIQKLGIHERKSLTLDFPTPEQVPNEFLSSYILGYFEGDGCISHGISNQNKIWSYVGICCTKSFGEKLQQILSERGIKSSMKRKKDLAKRSINSWSLTIDSSQPIIKFLDWIYRDSVYQMERKYQTYKEFRKQYDENGVFLKRN